MPPNVKTIEGALLDAVKTMWNSNKRDLLSVNTVRSHVENGLSLHEGFFKSEDWKSRSKFIITSCVENLEAQSESGDFQAKSAAEPRGGSLGQKREPSDEAGARRRKRQKEEEPLSPPPKQTGATSLSNPGNQNDGADPKATVKRRKTQQHVTGPKRKTLKTHSTRVAIVSEDEDEDKEDSPDRQNRHANDGSAGDPANEARDDMDDDMEAQLERRKKLNLDSNLGGLPSKAAKSPQALRDQGAYTKAADTDTPRSDVNAIDGKENEPVDTKHDSDSTMSVVMDEPIPKRRRRANPEGVLGAGGAKRRAAPKKTPGKREPELPPDEAEIKKLQSQLLKCGVRKIWAFELKPHGDDSRAKIRHLKSMLRDIGMEGRFSEAKASQIKERRELEADLEAVQEMNKNWGVGGRASRSRATKSTLDEEINSDEDDDVGGAVGSKNDRDSAVGSGDGDKSESDVEPLARPRGRPSRARADLAFLGSESESD